MNTIETNVKVHITFDQSDPKYEGAPAGENMWAIQKDGTDLYVVKNVPFFAYDVTYLDVVRAVEQDGLLEVQEVVASGGLGLVRAILMNGGLAEVVDRVEAKFPAAHMEGGFGALLSLAIAKADVDALVAFLDEQPEVDAVEVAA